jgi:beta-lactam-binding protein with PASTA domain
VFLSDGPERIPVPSLAGKDLDDAKDTLADKRLKAGKVEERFSASVDSGKVIRTTPKAGTGVRPDTTVNLVVSKGQPPIDVPNVVDRRLDDALRRLDRAGLTGNVAGEVFSDDVDRGKVVRQDPGGDERAEEGATVELFVSKGPQQFEVPDVIGRSVQDARRILERAGFKTRTLDVVPGGPDNVRAQIPGAGTQRPKGATITLSVF